MNDDYNLQRFIDAQDAIYDDVLATLRRGGMCSPHMDFIFPRLGSKSCDLSSKHFALTSLDEARAYLAVPVLGGRYPNVSAHFSICRN